MNEHSEMFFESYRLAQKAAYDSFLEISEKDFDKVNSNRNNELDAYLQNEYQKWLCTPVPMLEGKTPVEYLKAVNSFDMFLEMFVKGAVICDDDLPGIFLDKFMKDDGKAADALIEIAAESGADHNRNDMIVRVMAVKVLGEYHVECAVEPLIKLLVSGEGEASELMSETIRDSLVCIGYPALDSICNALDSEQNSEDAVEYLLMALTEIGKKNPSDKIYQKLKENFLRSGRKIVAASCLGDYGDGRAVTALRGFLGKNQQELDRETFYEIVSAIRKLGGRVDDLKSMQ